MSEVFQLFECGDVFQFTDPTDSYETWQGLRGPKGDPGEPGPKGDPGTGLYITGTVADVDDLPESAPQSTIYNVGTEAPYELYMYETGTGWISLGYLEGPPGPAGPAGEDGQPGAPGAAATIAVGTVSGLPAGSTPTVTNSGSSSAAVFNFGIPAGATGATGPEGPEGPPGKGLTISGTVASTSQLPATAEQGTVYNVGASEPYELYMYETGTGWISLGYLEGPEGPQGPAGPAGEDGQPGAPGAAATIAVGTVSGLPAGSTPTVTNSGSSSEAVFNFGIPAGATGATGPAGPGVASGGTAGQYLVKASNTNYDTTWESAPINFANGTSQLGALIGESPYVKRTMVNLWAVIPNYTIVIGWAANFLTDPPDPGGILLVIKHGGSSDSGAIKVFASNFTNTANCMEWTMAVSASSGAPSGVWLRANQLGYSPIIGLPAGSTRVISSADIGGTFVDRYSSTASTQNILLTLSQANSSAFPVGSEIAISRIYSQSTRLTVSGIRLFNLDSGVIGSASGTATIQIAQYGMIAIKKIESNTATYGDVWLLTGNCEVVP